jgi:hypothetical protein
MNTKTEGLSYVEDENGFSRYTYSLEGRRVLDVLVDNNVFEPVPEGAKLPEGVALHPISICMVDAPIVSRQATKGFGASKPHITMEGVTTQVDGLTVRAYLEPRLAVMLARLFVPPAS